MFQLSSSQKDKKGFRPLFVRHDETSRIQNKMYHGTYHNNLLNCQSACDEI